MLDSVLNSIYDFLWGPAMIALIMGTGVFLTFKLKFLPIRNLPHALSLIFKKSDDSGGDISPFQSLMTALAATLGTGNIAGVASALVAGGPGAVVWMWICALFGLSTKYAESVLAVKFRQKNSKGEMCGGPMYAMKNGFRLKKLGAVLGILFSVFTVIASFGIGNMTQVNSISTGLYEAFSVPPALTGAVTAALTALILIGGIKSIGKVCGVLVPVMAIGYILGTVAVIAVNITAVPSGVYEMIKCAFSFRSAGGGAIGITVAQAIKTGISRGVFSNEAGLGSASIAAAAAKTDRPSKQGYVNMTGTFFDTLLMCTLTALAIAASGVLGVSDKDGAALTIEAYESSLGTAGQMTVALGLVFFAFSTVIGWEYYGEKALEYLTKKKYAVTVYRAMYSLACFLGAVWGLESVWKFSDISNALMAIPNLICLIVLSPVITKDCIGYQCDRKEKHKQKRKR